MLFGSARRSWPVPGNVASDCQSYKVFAEPLCASGFRGAGLLVDGFLGSGCTPGCSLGCSHWRGQTHAESGSVRSEFSSGFGAEFDVPFLLFGLLDRVGVAAVCSLCQVQGHLRLGSFCHSSQPVLDSLSSAEGGGTAFETYRSPRQRSGSTGVSFQTYSSPWQRSAFGGTVISVRFSLTFCVMTEKVMNLGLYGCAVGYRRWRLRQVNQCQG